MLGSRGVPSASSAHAYSSSVCTPKRRGYTKATEEATGMRLPAAIRVLRSSARTSVPARSTPFLVSESVYSGSSLSDSGKMSWPAAVDEEAHILR